MMTINSNSRRLNCDCILHVAFNSTKRERDNAVLIDAACKSKMMRQGREEDTKLKTEMPRNILGRKSPRSVLKSRTWTSITDLGS
jgi:hypothetical protein